MFIYMYEFIYVYTCIYCIDQYRLNERSVSILEYKYRSRDDKSLKISHMYKYPLKYFEIIIMINC